MLRAGLTGVGAAGATGSMESVSRAGSAGADTGSGATAWQTGQGALFAGSAGYTARSWQKKSFLGSKQPMTIPTTNVKASCTFDMADCLIELVYRYQVIHGNVFLQ